jgi:hypothetical protein
MRWGVGRGWYGWSLTGRKDLNTLDDLHNIFIVQNMFFANLLRVMLDRVTPYKSTLRGKKSLFSTVIKRIF